MVTCVHVIMLKRSEPRIGVTVYSYTREVYDSCLVGLSYPMRFEGGGEIPLGSVDKDLTSFGLFPLQLKGEIGLREG